jgi:hypothetical protein
LAAAKDRALFLKERAFEMVTRQGTLERIRNAGIGRSYAGNAFTIETFDTDEYHRLDIRSGGYKVFSVAWRTGESAQIVTSGASSGSVISLLRAERKS